MKPTRTINPIHFEDLENLRFEDLSVSLVYRMHRWFELNHFGRAGADDGIDIQGTELLDTQKKRLWHFQCKRYKKIGKKELEGIIDKIIEKSKDLPDIIVAIISCNVRKNNVESFKEYASKKNINEAQIWTSSIIEAKLYSEYHDFLFTYFDINLTHEKQNKIATVRRNIQLKKRMQRDFLKTKTDGEPYDPLDRIRNPFKKFKNSELLIRSIDDSLYPYDNNTDEFGNYSWCKVDPYDFYYNGLMVIYTKRRIVFDNDGNWDIFPEDELQSLDFHEDVVAFEIGCIPYENIIEYDIEGDGHYGFPHVFCDYRKLNTPYEDIVYAVPNKEGYELLSEKNRCIEKRKVNVA